MDFDSYSEDTNRPEPIFLNKMESIQQHLRITTLESSVTEDKEYTMRSNYYDLSDSNEKIINAFHISDISLNVLASFPTSNQCNYGSKKRKEPALERKAHEINL
ncbi:hypothetical protein AYI68_g3900 [Smittium mucronatum]|uniref:Uncharacterized protein n=1 Tax=Smittium mucronatum TaxID=133383 RepID=A0A1R0GYL5_9FUNG|nr:hypothetical protein AYI68_g3900 [Smittium mucronatum]